MRGLVPTDSVTSVLVLAEHLQDLTVPDALTVGLRDLDHVRGQLYVNGCPLAGSHGHIPRLALASDIRMPRALVRGYLRSRGKSRSRSASRSDVGRSHAIEYL